MTDRPDGDFVIEWPKSAAPSARERTPADIPDVADLEPAWPDSSSRKGTIEMIPQGYPLNCLMPGGEGGLVVGWVPIDGDDTGPQRFAPVVVLERKASTPQVVTDTVSYFRPMS